MREVPVIPQVRLRLTCNLDDMQLALGAAQILRIGLADRGKHDCRHAPIVAALYTDIRTADSTHPVSTDLDRS